MSEVTSWLRRPLARSLSLLLCAPLALLLVLHPMSVVNSEGSYSHGLLSLVMWGIAGGFVHGMGFDPYSRVWKLLFYPLLNWLWLALGYALILLAR
jgi:cyd operon protein YbgE